jgi:hypothetical protein
MSNFYPRKGATFDGFVAQKHMMNKFCFGWEGKTEVAFLQKATFIKVVLAFVSRLAPECKPLVCHVCGPYPKWMGFDGVSLAMSKDNVLWDTVETIHPKDQSVVPLGDTVLKLRDRLFLQTVSTRKLLQRFCSANPPLTGDEFDTLLQELQEPSLPLATMLIALHEEERRRSHPIPVYNFSFPGFWKEFFLLLSTTTSVSWILRPSVIPLLLHLLQTRQYGEDVHQKLSMFCPPLSFALLHVRNGTIPATLVSLLEQLIQVVKTTHPNLTFEAEAPAMATHIPTVLTNKSSKKGDKEEPDSSSWLGHLQHTITQIQKSHVPLSTGISLFGGYIGRISLN